MNPGKLVQIVDLFLENQEIENMSLSNIEVSESEFTQIMEKLSRSFSKYEYDSFDCKAEEYTAHIGEKRVKVLISYQKDGNKVRITSLYMYREVYLA